MQFKDIIGQDELKRKLINSVKEGRVGHALLFTGENGNGVLPMALAFAQYLNCENRGENDSCGKCASCLQNAELAHPDTNFVFPVNATKSVTAEQATSDMFIKRWREQVLSTGGYFDEQMWQKTIEIENKFGNINRKEADEIIRKLSFKSFSGGYKVMIIWQCDKMNQQAANALLKILEEPWEKTIFILTTNVPDKLLATIISRTQSINIPSIESYILSRYLAEKYDMNIVDAEKLARFSRGNLIEALRTIDGSQQDEEYFEMFVQLMRLSYENRHMELIEWAENISSMIREQQKYFLGNSIRLLRNSYMITAGISEISYLTGKEAAFCKKFAPYVNNKNIEKLVAEIELAIRQITQNGNPRIVFMHFALAISKLIVKL